MIRLARLSVILVVFISIIGCPATSSAQDMTDAERKKLELCFIIQANRLLDESKNHDSNFVLRPHNDPQLGKQNAVKERVSPRLSVFAVIPRDDCYFKAVFDRQPTKANLKAIEQSRAFLRESFPETRSRHGFEFQLTQFLDKTDATFVAFIGHNENGRFRFNDGKSASLSEIAKLCAERGKRPIFLSCEAQKYIRNSGYYGVTSTLTYEEAISIARGIQKYFERAPAVSYDDVVRELPVIISNLEQEVKLQYQIRYVARKTATVGGGAGAVIGMVIVIEKVFSDFPEAENLVGREAAAFAYEDINSKLIDLQALKGRVILLNFWASWCPVCRGEMPTIQRLHQQLKNQGLSVISVNMEDPKTARSFLREHRYTFSTLVDDQKWIQGLYEVDAVPTIIVIGKDGKIAAQYVGSVNEVDLLNTLKETGINTSQIIHRANTVKRKERAFSNVK